jgi:uncharacterized protein YqhQ
MALANGLLVHGPTHWAAAVRESDGGVLVASGAKPRLAFGLAGRIPVVRGVLRLAESMLVVPAARRGLPQARMAMEDAPVGAAVVLSLVAAAVARRRLQSPLAQEAVAAVAGLAPALVALRSSDAAIWHGVEHKSIAAYERGGAAAVADAAQDAKEHTRCGSNLVLPMLVATTVGNALGRRYLPGRGRLVARAAVAAASVGAAVEAFAFAQRHPGHPVSRVVHGAGHAIQAGFATREPGPDELAVGRAAMEALLRVER